MKFKTYKLIDLIMLSVLALVIELIATMTLNRLIPFSGFRTYPVIGLFISVVALTRWKLPGIVVLPFNILGCFIAGYFINDKAAYLAALPVLLLGGLASLISLQFFKKNGVKKTFSDIEQSLLLLLSIIALHFVATLFSGVIMSYIIDKPDTGFFKLLGVTALNTLINSAFGYLILILATSIFKSMGLLVNVKDKFLEMKKEKENEINYYKNLNNEKKGE